MLTTDGRTWLGRGELAAAAHDLTAAAPSRPGTPADARRLHRVPTDDPLSTVTQLLAALTRGDVPALEADPPIDLPDALPTRTAPAGPDSTDPGGRGHDLPEEPLLVLPTSGSTAAPRAVVRTVASWTDSFAPFTELTGITRQDLVWVPGGLSSTLGLFGVWHALDAGARVLASGRWRGADACGPAAARATVVQCVPVVLGDVLDARDAGLLPGLRLAVVAGAVTTGSLRRRAARSGVRLVEYYGAAELSFVAVDPDGLGLRPFPRVEVAVRGGTVWARSPYTALGYLPPGGAHPGGPADGSRHTDGPLRRDPDGWCTVGDRGRPEAGGRLAVLGRGGDAASVGGHVVLLADVETALGTVDGVAEVVCLAEPHARLGERVVAAVRPDGGHDPVPGLRATARRALPAPARPVRYVLVNDLPRTTGGKVARAVLRDRITHAGHGTRQ